MCVRSPFFLNIRQREIFTDYPNSATEPRRNWDQQASVLWENGQQIQAINRVVQLFNERKTDSPNYALQVCYYLYMRADYLSAAFILEQQLIIHPESYDLLINLAVCLGRANQHHKALEIGKKITNLNPDDYLAFDVMCKCYYMTSQFNEATKAGNRSLAIKNSISDLVKIDNWQLPSMIPSLFVKGKKNVVSFSLWGDNPRYLRGALRNILLRNSIYPEWHFRFYVNESVPHEFINLMIEHGAKIVIKPIDASLKEKLAWRFEVANDAEVGYFLVRDVDSVISERELLAVNNWLNSNKYFHVMRDWWTHSDLVLAGMWGGVANVLPDITSLLNEYDANAIETPNIDQWFLRDKVWVYIRQSCLSHDRCFTTMGSEPFPGNIPPTFHVGQNEFSAFRYTQEQALSEYIKEYPCLRI